MNTLTRPLIADYRQVLAELVKNDLEGFTQDCLQSWPSAEAMANELATCGWGISVRTCRNWRNRTGKPKHADVRAVKHIIKIKKEQAKRDVLRRDIEVLEARIAIKKAGLLK